MIFEELSIKGAFLITPEPFADDRGMFRRHFCSKEFAEAGITIDVEQCNVSENYKAGTLRGFHYQLRPYGEGKSLSCLVGEIYDIIVDMRPESPTYMKWVSVTLNGKNRKMIHIPPGCANAFLTMQDDCIIHYYCSHAYTPDAERGVRWDDPAFGFEWPIQPAVISDKDKNHPDHVI